MFMNFPGEEEEESDSETSEEEYENDDVAEEFGELVTFGYGYFGQLGTGSSHSFHYPQIINISLKVRRVATGESHCLAVAEEQVLFSWGCNRYGQLGIGNNLDVMKPLKVESMTGINLIDVACGAQHSVILTSMSIMRDFY
jgi:alpha-tubulin suppressor-like RCC1 family protein